MMHFKQMGFRIKLIIMICLFSVSMVLAVSFFNYRWYSKELTTQTISQTQQIIEQTSSNINVYLDELNRLTLAPYYDDTLLAALEEKTLSFGRQLENKRTIDNFLSSAMILPRNEILRVYIMNDENIYSYTRTPYEMSDYATYSESSWYKEALSTTKPIYIPPHFEKAFGDKQTPVFSIVRQIRSTQDNNRILGVIKVDADYSGIKKICDRVKLKDHGALLILNNENQIIYQTGNLQDTSMTSHLIQNATSDCSLIRDASGNLYIFNEYSVASSGLRIIALNSYQELLAPIKANLEKTILLAFFCTLLIIAFFTVFIKKFLKPLSEIIELMKRVENGQLDVQATIGREDEIGYLALSFNKMVQNLQKFIQKNTQLVKEIFETQYLYKESQYNALCSQIKPHFLYNTLNTISLLVKCRENEQAVHVIEAFSTYLGGIMNVSKEISLKDELNICQAYLSIMQIRYEDKLSYCIEVEEHLCSCRLPSLSIQPLVENAIKYGCEPKREKTEIKILGYSVENGYKILVSDNGVGMESDTLKKVQQQLADDITNDDTEPTQLLGNIGLINIFRRISLKFNKKATLEIDSSVGNGTTVTLFLPTHF